MCFTDSQFILFIHLVAQCFFLRRACILARLLHFPLFFLIQFIIIYLYEFHES